MVFEVFLGFFEASKSISKTACHWNKSSISSSDRRSMIFQKKCPKNSYIKCGTHILPYSHNQWRCISSRPLVKHPWQAGRLDILHPWARLVREVWVERCRCRVSVSCDCDECKWSPPWGFELQGYHISWSDRGLPLSHKLRPLTSRCWQQRTTSQLIISRMNKSNVYIRFMSIKP